MRFISRLGRWYEQMVGDLPWVKAVGIVVPLAVAVVYISRYLPAGHAVDWTNANIYVIFCSVIFVIYFLLVAVFYQARLGTERELRKVEQGFRYDKRGTLYNGSQPNIAFRVATFKGILLGLTSFVEEAKLQNALFKSGASAAKDFAAKLPKIYDADIQTRRGGSRWENLSMDEKLSEWMDYDSATGWGILTAQRPTNALVNISVNHQRDLLEGAGGLLFAHFLAGYCQTVLASIVLDHSIGHFRDINKAELKSLTPQDSSTTVFSFALS